MITLSPVGLSSTSLVENQVSLLVTIDEKLAKTYCINSTIQPQITLNYAIGESRLSVTDLENTEGTVFVPIKATVSISIPDNYGNIVTRLYTEHFDVAFQGQIALPKSVDIKSVGRDMFGTNIKCCKVHNYIINDSVTVKIVPNS